VGLKRRYLKHDSDGSGNFSGLKEMSDAEFMRVASVSGAKFATTFDSTDEGNIKFSNTSFTTNADSIGRVIDTSYLNDADDTDLDAATLITETLFLAMQNTESFGDAGSAVALDKSSVGFVGQLPLVPKIGLTNTTLEMRSFTTGLGADSTNDLLDDIIVKIFENDLPGTYHFDDSARTAIYGVYNTTDSKHYPDSDRWQILNTIIEDRAHSGTTAADSDHLTVNFYQKISLTSGSAADILTGAKVNPMFGRLDGNRLLTDLKAAADSDYARLISSALCARIADNQINDRVGKLVISDTSPGVAYRELGSGMLDQRRGTADVTADGPATDFARVLGPSLFTRVLGPRSFSRRGEYPVNYSGSRTSGYSGTRTANYSGTRAVTFAAVVGTGTADRDTIGTFKLFVKIA